MAVSNNKQYIREYQPGFVPYDDPYASYYTTSGGEGQSYTPVIGSIEYIFPYQNSSNSAFDQSVNIFNIPFNTSVDVNTNSGLANDAFPLCHNAFIFEGTIRLIDDSTFLDPSSNYKILNPISFKFETVWRYGLNLDVLDHYTNFSITNGGYAPYNSPNITFNQNPSIGTLIQISGGTDNDTNNQCRIIPADTYYSLGNTFFLQNTIYGTLGYNIWGTISTYARVSGTYYIY